MKGCLGIILILAGIPLIPVGVGIILILLGIGVLCAPETSATASASATSRSDVSVNQTVTVNVGGGDYAHYDIFPRPKPAPPPPSALEKFFRDLFVLIGVVVVAFVCLVGYVGYCLESARPSPALERAIQAEKHHPKP